ncbi:hypothetical protein K5D42_25055 [Pseudomonas cichorii]|nr:hypothetical protein [Pseudomonas cichorii]MBX8493142.1 hypothetical protein [Pseudomonas cichorii]
MKVIRIQLAGTQFLLPEGHGDYEFPGYVLEHKARIEAYVTAFKAYARNMLTGSLPVMSDDLKAFRQRTGIIGYPFDMHDANLFALDPGRGVTVVLDLAL